MNLKKYVDIAEFFKNFESESMKYKKETDALIAKSKELEIRIKTECEKLNELIDRCVSSSKK